MLGLIFPAGADILLVSNNDDSGPGSLRQALLDNAAMGGGHTIVFSNIVTDAITLASALQSTTNVTINGPGATVLTLSGNNDRVFEVTGGSFSLSGVTIVGGLSAGNGAGIFSSTGLSPLTLRNCVFVNNYSMGNGGAVYSENPGVILNSTFVNNRAGGGNGGAIYCYVGLSITNCTFAYNDAASGPVGRGGAICCLNLNSTTTEIYNCTIVSNTAALTGGGVALFGPVVAVRNSIIAGNFAPLNWDADGPFTSQGYNLIGYGGTSTGWTNTGDQVGIVGAFINPLLGPLLLNGGSTPTFAPLLGSPAIDRAKSGDLVLDQRERPRPFDNPAIANATGGDGADIGAVELGPLTWVVSNNNDGGPGSLRRALFDAGGSDGDTIRFSPAVTGRITLTNGELAFAKTLSITGPGANVLTVSGNNSNRIFQVTNSTATVTISGLTLSDGRVVGARGPVGGTGQSVYGGAVLNRGNLTMRGCVISNSVVIGGEGGVQNPLGTSGNGGNGSGGAIANLRIISLIECLLTANVAQGGAGGAILDGTMPGTGGQGRGGGLYSEDQALLTLSTVSSNTASAGTGPGASGSGSGGGLYNGAGMAVVTCTVAHNSAMGSGADSGGGIADFGAVIMHCSTVASNSATTGGGVSMMIGSIGDSILAGNSAGTGPDCYGSFISNDYNLIQNNSDVVIMGGVTHDIFGVAPLLGPLGNNGGPTPTMPLLPGSPAIDQGHSFQTLTDQRRGVRPFDKTSITNAGGGDGSDIGAFEVGGFVAVTSVQSVGSDIQISFTTDAGNNYALQQTGDLSSGIWTTIATNVVGTGGNVTVTNAGASGMPQRFYRAESLR